MRIRLGTLNVWGMPEPLSREVSKRIDAIGERLAGFDLDVMAFQEVWTTDARRSLERAGKRAGLVHSFTGDDDGWTQGHTTGGLLVLSRLPITDVRFESFALRGEPERAVTNLEYVSGKGFATITLRTPDGPLVLVNTHLHARYKVLAHNNLPHRTGQTIQLATSYAERKAPMVLVGDFNFLEGELDYRMVTGLMGLRDAAAELDLREDTTLSTNPYRTSQKGRRKDFVFVRDGATKPLGTRTIERVFDEPLEFDGRPGAYSDHAGLIVELELGGASEAGVAAELDRSSLYQLASEALADGKREAKERRAGGRKLSGIGVGFAAAAGLCMLPERVSRRKMLRMSLGATAFAALTPGLGFSVVSEVLVENEIAAFKQAAAQLARLDPGPATGGNPSGNV